MAFDKGGLLTQFTLSCTAFQNVYLDAMRHHTKCAYQGGDCELFHAQLLAILRYGLTFARGDRIVTLNSTAIGTANEVWLALLSGLWNGLMS